MVCAPVRSIIYTGYCGTSEIEHGLCACTVDNPLTKARGLSLRTGAQPMLYLPHVGERETFRGSNSFAFRFIRDLLSALRKEPISER